MNLHPLRFKKNNYCMSAFAERAVPNMFEHLLEISSKGVLSLVLMSPKLEGANLAVMEIFAVEGFGGPKGLNAAQAVIDILSTIPLEMVLRSYEPARIKTKEDTAVSLNYPPYFPTCGTHVFKYEIRL